VLCSACEKKLQEGKISALDVELSRILYKIGKGEIGFDRAIDTEKFVIILTNKEQVGKIIGKGGDHIKFLSKKLKKPVRVIGTENLERMIYDFVYPAKILSINLVYKPDGSTKYRVEIDKKDKKKLRMKTDEIKDVISSISESEVEISLE
jgi:transcription antitermination factor NusA-like protein